MKECEFLYFTSYSIEPSKKKIIRSSLNNELIYIKNGNGKVYCENTEFNIEPDTVIAFASGTIVEIETDGGIQYTCVGFRGIKLTEKPVVAKDGSNYSISFLLDTLKREYNNQNFYRRNMMTLLLNVIIITFARLAGYFFDESSDLERDNFDFVVNLIGANNSIGMDIEYVTKSSGLSYHRFRHRFKEITGISPQQYIIRQRINLAKMLLENPRHKTASIAEACGFKSVPQFITCFSKQEGITPIKYRKKHIKIML